MTISKEPNEIASNNDKLMSGFGADKHHQTNTFLSTNLHSVPGMETLPSPIHDQTSTSSLYPRLSFGETGLKLPIPTSSNQRTSSSDPECFYTADEGEPNEEVKIPLEISKLSTTQLRQRLQTYGVEVGPIQRDTRKLYEKKLASLEQQYAVIAKRKEPSMF